MSGTAALGLFLVVGLPFIAGLVGLWQAYTHKLRGEKIWKVFGVLTATAFVGVALVSVALIQNAFNYYRVEGWAVLGAALTWFLLPLIVGGICLHKANKFRNQQNSKWKIYFAVGAPLTFIIPAIGLWITWMIAQPPLITCYVPIIRDNILYDNVMLAGMLLKRENILNKIYKKRKISKEVYEKLKKTLR